MKLSRFIQKNLETLLNSWDDYAHEIGSAEGYDLTPQQIRDHARGMLERVAEETDESYSAEKQKRASKGHAAAQEVSEHAIEHGVDRYELGFSIDKMVSEFRALRTNVMLGWMEKPIEASDSKARLGELIGFNQAIDQLLAVSIGQYLDTQEFYQKELQTILESLPSLTFVLDRDGTLSYSNKTDTSILGHRLPDLIQKTLLQHGLETPAKDSPLSRLAQLDEGLTGHIQVEDPQGNPHWLEYAFNPVQWDEDTDGRTLAMAATIEDITEQKLAEEASWRLANYDPLTDLPNRRLFHNRLADHINQARRTGEPIALLFIDLDRFKAVNDTLGHEAGDEILRMCSERIGFHLRDTDTVARLAGDEFVAMLVDMRDTAALYSLCTDIIDSLRQPFFTTQGEANIGASIGIALFPDDANDQYTLIKCADKAMYKAKNDGRGRCAFYRQAKTESVRDHFGKLNALEQALTNDEFRVYFQPVFNLADGKLAWAEALLRWEHPDEGLLSAHEFLEEVTAMGSIGPLGDWVWEQCVAFSRHWRQRFNQHCPISINRIPQEYQYRASTPRAVAHGVDLIEEIPCQYVNQGDVGLWQALNRRRDQGIPIAVEKFGIQGCNLSDLQHLGASFLKLAPFTEATPSQQTGQLIQAITLMAHQLDMKVAVTGVETREQYQMLANMACDFAQGYWLSRPLSPEQFERRVLTATSH